MTAPGRYCLAICYCGECAHYVPIVRHRDKTDQPTPDPQPTPKRSASAWDQREEGKSWIDKL